MGVAPEAAEAADAYRAELRGWLAGHLTDRYRGLRFSGAPTAERLALMQEWNALLADAGHAAPAWPAAWGGRDAGVLEQLAHAEEMAAAAAPGPVNALGIPNIAPAIMASGTPEQQERYLRPLLRGEEVWCQGFSEPDAGSDLASLRCVAKPDGDHYLVSGQKMWTTLGSVADWCELLVRTDPDPARKHAGITALLVDMRTPGIEVRPLRTMAGTAEFCEVFLDDVRVPTSARLGAEGEGWLVATSTLANERGAVAALHLDLRRRIDGLVDEARAAGRTADPRVRDRLASLWSAGELLRLLADRAVARAAAGEPPGPESSIIKIAWSSAGQLLPEVALEVFGVEALDGPWAESLAAVRALSIAGGTTEVNRNIVAERVLGLPAPVSAVGSSWNHVGHHVADLDRAVAFYTGVFGFTEAHRLRIPDGAASTLLQVPAPVGLTAVYLTLGGAVLELLHLERPGNEPARERRFTEPGLTHLSFTVDDVAATCRAVEAHGGEVLADTDVGGFAVMVRDPDGQLLELLPPGALPATGAARA